MKIVKADGTKEEFNRSKLISSLERSGTGDKLINEIIEEVEKEIVEGMHTREIYRQAYDILKKHELATAGRYSLRRAILSLGPTGFPFENFLAELFRVKGYHTELRQVVEGSCATHEVDLIVNMGDRCTAVEAKFHNSLGAKIDLKIALYVHARFIDLIDRKNKKGEPCFIDEGWLITNTKFTKNSIQYAECSKITFVGWNYPKKGNLQDMIEETGVQPITCLTTLSKGQKNELLKKNIVLCRNLPKHIDELKRIGIKESKIKEILEETSTLCALST